MGTAGRIGSIEIAVAAANDEDVHADDARRFAIAVWRGVDDALERLHPGSVVRIATWDERWEVSEEELRAGATSRVVRNIVDSIAQRAEVDASSVARPPPAAGLVRFRSEAARIAAWLVARTRRSTAWEWVWRDLDTAATADALLDGLTSETAVDVLVELERTDCFDTVVDAFARRTVKALADRLDSAATGVAEAADGAGAADDADDDAAMAGEPARRSNVPTEAADPFNAGDTRGPTGDAARLAAKLRRSMDRRVARPTTGDERRGAGTGPDPAGRFARASDGPLDPPLPTTRWAGLAYLLRPLLHRRVGEALWEACLPERDVIRSALTMVAGDDPIVEAITAAPHARRVDAHLDQLAAVRSAVLSQLDPERLGELMIVHSAATTDAVPFGRSVPVASWVDTPTEECIAELERHGLRAVTVAADSWATAGMTAIERALTASVLGVAVTSLQLDLSSTEVSLAEFADRWLAQPGAVRVAGDEVTIAMAGEAIDLDLRRIGADADPGWLPWAERTVRIEFDVREAD